MNKTHTQTASQAAIDDCLNVLPTSDYVLVNVPRDTRIDKFVRDVTGSPYIKGSAFYQLTKKVLVQKHKQIYIFDRDTKNVYQGEYARSLLGLPDTTCQVVPILNDRYDIFIQSTSLNRRLSQNTKLLILQ